MDSPDWSNLPTDPLLLILGKLPVIDYLRFGAVCGSWKRLVLSRLVSPAPQPPVLMLSDPSPGNCTQVMFDPFTNKEQCRIKLPKHDWYRGSTSDGYVILQTGPELLVFNPLTRSGVNLPSLKNTHMVQMRITSSASNPTPKTVFAIYYYCMGSPIQRLAFCKPGDESWTDLVGESVLQELRDILIYEEKLYGLTGDSGALCTFDLKKNSQRKMVTTPTDGYSYYDLHMHLVKSSNGELLKVHNRYSGSFGGVFKLDTGTNEWRRLWSFQDDAIMILDVLGRARSNAMCISTRDFPKLQGNCIYSTKHYGMEVFSLSDGTMEEHTLPLCEDKLAYWFVPCLGVCPMSD